MSFPWVPCVLRFGFMLVAASSAIRRNCAQLLSSANSSIHLLITADLGVEKVSSQV
jgi:hypothetical protein